MESNANGTGFHDPVNSESFRYAMRHVPSVVTVITIGDDEGIQGVTIGSFVSLSLDPPLVCFNVQKSISIHDRILEAPGFAVHVLREDQASLSDVFARSDLEPGAPFEGLAYTRTENGIPLLDDCLVRFLCNSYSILSGGDHSIVIGTVINIVEGQVGRPVVYHQRAYHGVGRHIADHDPVSDNTSS